MTEGPLKGSNLKPMGASVTSILKFHADKNSVPNVDCSGCNAQCCRQYEVEYDHGDDESLFTHVGKDGQRILPRNDLGACDHLVNGACDIYDRRPRACRHYDCRPFALANTLASESTIHQNTAFNVSMLQWDVPSAIRTKDDADALCNFKAKAISMINSGADIQTATAAAVIGKSVMADSEG